MESEPKDARIPVMMSRSEVQAIDDWRFANRVNSRGEAIRQLIQLGLSRSAKKPPKAGR